MYIRTAGAVWWDGGRGSIGAMRGGSNPSHVRNRLLLEWYSRRYSMVVPLTLCRMFQNFQCLYSVSYMQCIANIDSTYVANLEAALESWWLSLHLCTGSLPER